MTLRPACAAALGAVLLAAVPLQAAPPWSSLLPFRRGVEADPAQPYWLEERHGPWLILAASFSGEQAEEQARQLVQELRARYKLPAYVWRRTSDYSGEERGLGVTPDGQPKRMRYLHGGVIEESVVLVGDFASLNDPRLEDTLETIKYAAPECLVKTDPEESALSFASLRAMQRYLAAAARGQKKGPMGSAFAARNPLLPEEYFAPKGLDPLVVDMNQNAEFSLFRCRGEYTVKVATFRGADTMQLREIAAIEQGGELETKLEEAALKAHRLAAALRRRGVEAYEFHDLHESIVTVGSFASVGQPRPDGKIEIDPGVHRIMQTFSAQQTGLPGQAAVGLQPRVLEGIAFDIQPIPVRTPRASVAAAYVEQAQPLYQR